MNFIPPHSAQRRSRGFTLAEILTVIAIVGILAVLLIPVISKGLGAAKGAKCQSNLHQIHVAILAYAADHDLQYPEPWSSVEQRSWRDCLTGKLGGGGVDYLGSIELLECPAGGGYAITSLGLWWPTIRRTGSVPKFFSFQLKKSASWPLLLDSDDLVCFNLDNPTATAGAGNSFAPRHNGYANILMVDGHIEKAAYGDKRWNQKLLNNGTYY